MQTGRRCSAGRAFCRCEFILLGRSLIIRPVQSSRSPPQIVHELIERFDAHLKAENYYSVIANMRGNSPEQVASLLTGQGLGGLQGPTICNVYGMNPDGTASHGFYAATICVPKKELYKAVKALQKVRESDLICRRRRRRRACLFACAQS